MQNNLSFQRKSVQRDEILRVLHSTKTHPDALWIFENVKKNIPNISLGTVYRNLSELSQRGLILELIVKDNLKNYDADTSSHTHFLCTHCGKIIDTFIQPHSINMVDGNLVEKTSVIYYGICKDCLKSN